MSEKKVNKRNLKDRIISGWKAIQYSISEPKKLKKARNCFEKEYQYKDDKPLISVYSPTYNRGKLLIERAVKTVLAQTYTNFEYVIIGDCCTDDTEQLLSQVNDKRIKFFNLPVKSAGYPLTAEGRWIAGPVGASNAALDRVQGKWIARIDDDDSWTPDHLELLLKCAQEGNYEFVSALYEEKRWDQTKVINGEPAQSPYYTRKKKPPKGYNPKLGGTSTWLYRSYLKLFRYNIDCWRKGWNRVNDVDLSLRMFKASVRMGFVDKVLTYVYPRPGENTVGLEAYKLAEKKGFQNYYG